MNLPFFISRRITKNEGNSFSSTISRIAVASIALGLAAMMVSFLILRGFQENIKNKIFGFTGHMHINKYVFGNTFDEYPISLNSEFLKNYKEEYPEIVHVQEYGNKVGLLKTDDEVFGMIFKGISTSYDSTNLKQYLTKGRFLQFEEGDYAKELLISQHVANLLKLDTGDRALTYFVQNPPRARILRVVGIYETGLEEFDQKIVIGDLNLVREMNEWADTLAGGLELFLFDPELIDPLEEIMFNSIDYDLDIDKVTDKYIQIFDWLNLLNRNVAIFLSIVLFVACFNMVSILLILIMERTQMIGMLKALGATKSLIRRIFAYNGFLLILKGMVLGNLIGITFGLLQQQFHLIPLDPNNYYIDYVPIFWDYRAIIGINFLTFVLVNLTLYLPTTVIASIQPVRAIKFS